MKARMSRIQKARYLNKRTDPRRRRVKDDAQRRRQSAIARRPVVQQRRAQSAEAESPEPSQPTSPERGSPGTGLVWRKQYNLLPMEVQEELAKFREGVIADLGGEEELSTIKSQYVLRLAQLDTIINLVVLDLNTRGLLTVKGKVRSTVEAFFKAVDRYDKLSQRLGLERTTKNVGAIEQWLKDKKAREATAIDVAPDEIEDQNADEEASE